MNFKRFLRKIFPTARAKILSRSLATLTFENGCDVLVVGSGNDPYSRLFPKPQSYVCLDIAVSPGKTALIADAHKLPVLNEKFDVVFATEVFEHLIEPKAFIEDAYRVLRNGGKLVVTVPFMFHQHAHPKDYWRPTKETLGILCRSFSEVQVSNQGNRVHTISDLFTTSFSPWPIFFPFRIFNHLLVPPFGFKTVLFSKSTAPSGFMLTAIK